ncbi:MAG: hypothetical protein LRZ94_00910 [Candidatus Pacebacteria bacterium]|nr:hypothetical protein [Candidatus Paceibacterota bacterium]
MEDRIIKKRRPGAGRKPKVYKNMAIVALRSICKWSYYAIGKAFEDDDTNVMRVFKRDKDKYNKKVVKNNKLNK